MKWEKCLNGSLMEKEFKVQVNEILNNMLGTSIKAN